MPVHIWDSDLDFQYCTLSSCEIISGSVRLSGSTGTLLSDVRDSTSRVEEYTEFEIAQTVPSGSEILYYWRSGLTSAYIAEFWSDWELIDPTKIYTEFSISLIDDRMSTDWPIDELTFVGLEEYWRTGKEYLNSCRIGHAIVGLARIGRAGDKTNIVEECAFTEQIVNVDTPGYEFNADRVNVTIQYVPLHPLLGRGDQFVQFKAEMTSAVSGSLPSIDAIKMNYRMDVRTLMAKAFPLFYRRV
ncbi:hypothetical protein [Bacteroides sp.]|uniref:hypothetical protein n=1 Tax=Bacteroides sp. TaxID=29523 RepID=UPI0026220A79|nr:hypothetical protein [Bacteroides sp.]MDD3039585.1 hypothetical protein [Bacteroides sp.]